jgi:solute carrier family 35 (UDP-sugar transporter), member A1/2/3
MIFVNCGRRNSEKDRTKLRLTKNNETLELNPKIRRILFRNDNYLLKCICLISLVIYTTSMVLVTRYSRTTTTTNDNSNKQYLSTTVVFNTEIVKVFVCFYIVWIMEGSLIATFSKLKNDILMKPLSTLEFIVPSLLYSIQNNLIFIGITNLDAVTFQLTYQLKILTTAFFSFILLNKRITPIKWLSLLMLFIGVCLIQVNYHFFRTNLVSFCRHLKAEYFCNFFF